MYRRTVRNITIAVTFVAVVVAVWLSGYYAGQNDERAFTLGCEPGLVSGPCVSDARDAEYARVVAAIARTMRCSSEAEFAQGRDHECDPSEVEQDAGLTDAQGVKVYR